MRASSHASGRSEAAKLVDKVGNRRHWEEWAKDIAEIAARHIGRIKGSVTALAHDVLGFIRHWNRAEARPFRWTFAGRFVDTPVRLAA